MNVARFEYHQRLTLLPKQFPVVLLLGPRQYGKTTIAREIAKTSGAAFFDLEDLDVP